MFVCSYCGLPRADLVHSLAAPTGHQYGCSYEELLSYKAALAQAQQTAEGEWVPGRAANTETDQEAHQ